jgi:hypothetical protein
MALRAPSDGGSPCPKWCQKSSEKAPKNSWEGFKKGRPSDSRKGVREIQERASERSRKNSKSGFPRQRLLFGNPITNGLPFRRQKCKEKFQKSRPRDSRKVVREIQERASEEYQKNPKSVPEIVHKMVPKTGSRRPPPGWSGPVRQKPYRAPQNSSTQHASEKNRVAKIKNAKTPLRPCGAACGAEIYIHPSKKSKLGLLEPFPGAPEAEIAGIDAARSGASIREVGAPNSPTTPSYEHFKTTPHFGKNSNISGPRKVATPVCKRTFARRGSSKNIKIAPYTNENFCCTNFGNRVNQKKKKSRIQNQDTSRTTYGERPPFVRRFSNQKAKNIFQKK